MKKLQASNIPKQKPTLNIKGQQKWALTTNFTIGLKWKKG